MKKLYNTCEANFPRLDTDRFFIDYSNQYRFSEITDKTARFVEQSQLLDADLWKTFVDQFRHNPDVADLGWRGEYWGKMMRGACFVYTYTQNRRLYDCITQTVKDILTTEDELGRIAAYSLEAEFTGWDMWSRKYVLLGMQYFLEISEDDELKNQVIASMCRQVDYIASKIGNETFGKLPITHTSKYWYGLNSSSLLEPVVRLYNITGEDKYLAFAKHIVDEGGTYVENIFRLAEKKQLRLYQYPVTKAYEMISCFEGLLEYYRVTKEDWCKTAIINFADLVVEDDYTVIGSSGCTHELFDRSGVRQANTNNHPTMQETCVTVTLMKFFLQLNLFTGSAKYMDAFEKSYYNAYLGAINTENSIGDTSDIPEGYPLVSLPFDSYSPLTAGVRGGAIGGLRLMQGGKFYGCCVCIGAAGIGSVHKAALLTFEKGLVLNLFIKGEYHSFTPSGEPVVITIDTDYPAKNKISIRVNCQEDFVLKLRNPSFSKATLITHNDADVSAQADYTDIVCVNGENRIEITFDMPTVIIKPTPYGQQVLMNKIVWGSRTIQAALVPTYDEEDPLAKNNLALQKGPIMLAQDSRFGYDLSVAAEITDNDGFAEVSEAEKEFDCILTVNVKTKNGKIKLCDYASCGKLYGTNKNYVAVWIKNR